jgi:hypothetical protein
MIEKLFSQRNVEVLSKYSCKREIKTVLCRVTVHGGEELLVDSLSVRGSKAEEKEKEIMEDALTR